MSSALFKAVIQSYRSLQSSGDELQHLAWKCLTENITYRLDQSAQRDRLIGFKVLLQTVRKVRSGIKPYKYREGNPNAAILEGLFIYEDIKYEYVARQAEKAGLFISKTDLPAIFRGRLPFNFIRFAMGIAISCLFYSKNRANRAMHIAMVAELAALKKAIEELQIRRIYEFAPYLIDSNWSFLEIRDDVEHYKFPSPGPLRTHHHTLLAETLVICSAYHEEELPSLPNVKAENVELWLPESSFIYIDRYLSMTQEPKTGTLGYYSHASWLRKEEGHTDNGLNIGEAEDQVLQDLGSLLEKHPEWKIVIFPHPRERKEEILPRTHAFYQTYFQSEQFELSAPGTSTAFTFEQIDVAVSAFSAILYERLFCGYKTLIGNKGIPNFPDKGSALNAICFSDLAQLEEQILRSFSQSREAFFTSNGIHRYRYDAFPYFKKAATSPENG